MKNILFLVCIIASSNLLANLKDVLDKDLSNIMEKVVEWRHDIHQNPELGNREFRTAKKVADHLTSLGISVETGIAHTGVVGLLTGDLPGPRVAIRADMDALPVIEKTGLPYASTVKTTYLGNEVGVMHACGHDAHVAILMGAAEFFANNKDQLKGSILFIFQPAEEGLGGAKAMLEDKLFEKFPCDEIYGLHNWPTGELGKVSIKPGVAMAGADFFDIKIRAFGSHAARPEGSKDPIIIASTLISQLQSIVSRNVPPTETIVLSVTQIHSGTAYNVIPSECVIAGTMRYFDSELANLVRNRMRKIIAVSYTHLTLPTKA